VTEPLQTFSQSCLPNVRVTQVQWDALLALLSAVQGGAVREAEALNRLAHSSHWVRVAIDPVSKRLWTLDSGDRTLAMAPRVVHQGGQVLAPGCVPRFLPDGFQESPTALLAHVGYWRPPERHGDQGPPPQPRWRPRPQRRDAQVGNTGRRRRLVDVPPRGVCGPCMALAHGLAPRGGQSITAFVERLPRTIRPHGAAVGRRGSTLGTGADGGRQPLSLSHVYDHCGFPHASVCPPRLQPEPPPGTGAAQRWAPRTPAMAAGLTEHVWTRRAGLLFHVPPWPPPPRLETADEDALRRLRRPGGRTDTRRGPQHALAPCAQGSCPADV
jgi:hypothetical protein